MWAKDAAVSLLGRSGHLESYGFRNRRTSETDAGGSTTFGYDDAGNLTSLTDPELNTTTWTFDGLNRLIEETNELNDTRYFSYDANSNVSVPWPAVKVSRVLVRRGFLCAAPTNRKTVGVSLSQNQSPPFQLNCEPRQLRKTKGAPAITRRDQSNAFDEVVQFLAEQGFDGMAQAMQTLFNEMMKLERTAALGAAPYERSEARRGQANGETK